MDLSPAEEVLIGLLRGEFEYDFVINVARLGPTWSLSITSETDGLLSGSGDTFRAAICAAFGVENGPDTGEAAPVLKLRLVGGRAIGAEAAR